jgi:hypothetical protein
MQDSDVQSQELIDWINDEATGLRAHRLRVTSYGEAAKFLEAISEVAGSNQFSEVSMQLAMIEVVEVCDGCLLNGLVHPFSQVLSRAFFEQA